MASMERSGLSRSFPPRAHRGGPSGLRMPGGLETAVPRALQDLVAMRELLAWIREHEGAADPRIVDWLSRIAAEIEISGFPRTGINVLAYFSHPSGLQESALRYVRSLNVAGVATSSGRAASVSSDNKIRDEFLGLETYDTSLIHIQPESIFRSPMNRPAGTGKAYIISRCGGGRPTSFPRAGNWHPSPLTNFGPRRGSSPRPSPGLRCARLPCTLGIRARSIRRVDLGTYGVSTKFFRIPFHLRSEEHLERKNPLGLITAFKQAFRRDENGHSSSRLHTAQSHPEDFHRLQKEAKKCRRYRDRPQAAQGRAQRSDRGVRLLCLAPSQ